MSQESTSMVSVNVNTGEIAAPVTARDLKPAAEMTRTEIVSEARQLHAQFQELSERYQQAQPSQRAEVREEMAPLVNRERELRQEFGGRAASEVKQDRVPEPKISFGY